jgi:hypothetical protein
MSACQLCPSGLEGCYLCCETGPHHYVLQRSYVPTQGAREGAFEPMKITFRKGDRCGIPVRDAISKRFEGLKGRDSRPFEGVHTADQATLRIEVSSRALFRTFHSNPQGHPIKVARLPSLEFNREWNGCRAGRWLTVCQFRTRDHTSAKTPVTLSRLALEVCRGIEKFVNVSGRITLLRTIALNYHGAGDGGKGEEQQGVHRPALEGGKRPLPQRRHPHACLGKTGNLWVVGSVHLPALSRE